MNFLRTIRRTFFSTIFRSVPTARRRLCRGLFFFGFICYAGLTIAADEPIDPDPWSTMNRLTYRFNDRLDTWFLRPVARGYDRVMPEPLQRGLSNVFDNLGEPSVVINQVLQGKLKEGASDFGRFLINSTIGIGGLFDVAYRMGLLEHDENFGQTLAVWGVPRGPYLIIPLRGSATVTHACGMIVDAFTNPMRFIRPIRARSVTYGLYYVDLRTRLLGMDALISGDEYLFIRDAYLQQRDYLIKDGEIEDDPFLDDDFDD